jgi:predicted enzyme related to lactoylglutathione lyase
MPPTLANGKICYIEIPAVDIHRSADFYAKVFGWRLRQRGDGHTAFDDATGEVSGTWVLGRPASWSTAWPRPSMPSLPTAARWCNRSARTHPK